jgi:hypothetical protein
MALDVFNLFNALDSDIHSHPTLPRTVRINLIVGL